jgi:gliding motility-associated lipoprotein GldH
MPIQIRDSISAILIKGKTEDSMTKGINKYLFLIICLFIWQLYACKKNLIYTDSVTIPGEEWNLENVALFTPKITDSTNSNNIYISIRTGTSYPYRNIWLFVTTASPAGTSITDTLQYMLADEKGKWYGKGFGDIHELNLPFRTNVYFPKTGIYSFKIRHGMRAEILKGVYDIGLRIERAAK